MRTVVSMVVTVLLPGLVLAAPLEKLYFLGEIRLSSSTGNPTGSQVILLEKTQDRDGSTITERALVVYADGKVQESTMRLAIKADSTFTLSDDAKTVEGTGKLFGPAWKWTYFKGTFKTTKGGIHIEDENFMADDSMASARKKVIGPDNKVIMYMDMSLKAVTPKTYEILRAGLINK